MKKMGEKFGNILKCMYICGDFVVFILQNLIFGRVKHNS